MKILSWNVNGIRSIMKKGFVDIISCENPDIICIQETKVQEGQHAIDIPFSQYWNYAQKKGYSGTGVCTKHKPLRVTYGINNTLHDMEGRVITLEYDSFFLVNVYTPNTQRGLTRLAYRQSWDAHFLAYLKELETKKPVIFCGDLNVAHTEIDLANPKSNHQNAGFTPEERQGFQRLLDAGFIDSFREFTKDGGHYTWWSNFFNARARNIGWRIDYFCISPSLRPQLANSRILPHIMGSDHCPVELTLHNH